MRTPLYIQMTKQIYKMMKKKITYLFMALAMMLAFSSCGDDPEAILTPQTLRNTEWSGSFIKLRDGAVESSKIITVTFDSDNHGVYVLNGRRCDFNFTLKGLKFSLTDGYFTDVNGIYELESDVVGNTLVMSKSNGRNTETLRLNRVEKPL